ncbi:MAG TPA: CocE/NonD family hydrolase [Gaiellaceae bacterium]|nr:CocE/NonD family hydrolase [Gaiellaceae bacterium]
MTPVGERPRGESRLPLAIFAGASALVALHAAVDDLVAPEPGTGPGDHLLRARVTLALLLAGLAVFPLLRPGGKAALAAVLGALSLEATALAIADARAGGVRGEDWTGLVLGPVGLVLLVLAARLLWRSRRPGRWRWIRRAGVALATTVAVYWLVLPVAVAILATHRPRATVEPAELGRPYEQVTLRTSDGLRLAAWYVPSRNGAAVVSYPTRAGKLPQARMLVRHGYGVLLVDARGYDGSEGDPNVFGWDGAKDIAAAVAWLRRQPDVVPGRIGGIGFSVGGETMLQAAAENPQLHAAVSDGAGARSVREDVLRGPRGWFSLPENAVQTAAVSVLSGTSPPPPLQELVGRIAPRHVFLIWAGRSTAGEELNADYFRAARAPKALWKIADAGHVGGFDVHPREYERRVTGFFDRALEAD